MTWLINRLRDPRHRQHYGAVLLCGWLIAALAIYPAVIFPRHMLNELWGGLVAMAPALAHIYALRALLPLWRDKTLKPNMLAALWTLSYLPVALLAEVLLPWPQAYALPLGGAALALMSFGLLFPGLAPFIAYAVNAKWVRPHESRVRLGLAIFLFLLSWGLAAIMAAFMSAV